MLLPGVIMWRITCSPPLCHCQGQWWPAVLWGWLCLTRCHPQGPTHWWNPGMMAAGSTVPGCFHPAPLSEGQQTQAVGDRYPAPPTHKQIPIGKQTSKQMQQGVNMLWWWYPGIWASLYKTGSLLAAQQERDSTPWRAAWGLRQTHNLTQCMLTHFIWS